MLKPDSLTEEEWELMHTHPRLAYEMLEPIHYLDKALNIPYCHHEKWDGSGYPRGLKGTMIPLEARIFAVVDVWMRCAPTGRTARPGVWKKRWIISAVSGASILTRMWRMLLWISSRMRRKAHRVRTGWIIAPGAGIPG